MILSFTSPRQVCRERLIPQFFTEISKRHAMVGSAELQIHYHFVMVPEKIDELTKEVLISLNHANFDWAMSTSENRL